jgi:hypothetical protein
MAKIALLLPDNTDGCSWYRGAGVMPYLRKYGHVVEILPEYFTWADLIQYDILYMQRPYTPKDRAIYDAACDLNVKIWVDYDDDLWSIPSTNPASVVYNDKVLDDLVRFDGADLVTVSTDFLKERMREEGFTSVSVVPNSINDFIYGPISPRENYFASVESPLYWRGSDTHIGDLLHNRAQIQTILDYHEGEIHFFGFNPWMFKQTRKSFFVHEYAPAPAFMHELVDLEPGICLIPLDNRELFNSSKSSIAHLEALVVGATPIANMGPSFGGCSLLESYFKAVGAVSSNEVDHQKLIDFASSLEVNLSYTTILRDELIQEYL